MFCVFIDFFSLEHTIPLVQFASKSDGSNGRKYVASRRFGLDLMVFRTRASVELHEVRFVVAKH